jgi:hypothetical protein
MVANLIDELDTHKAYSDKLHNHADNDEFQELPRGESCALMGEPTI